MNHRYQDNERQWSGTWEKTSQPSTRVLSDHRAGPLARAAICCLGSIFLALAILAAPAASMAQVSFGISVSFGPPALPFYTQPPLPGPGYIWTPGYWAWDPDYGYYWVPGTWVVAPFPGALWTPGYWGWQNGGYLWNAGYWGPTVGFYGGIDYGFGYTGEGYQGGYWRGRSFYYNRSVTRITNVTNITNVYNKTVIRNVNASRVSYNGGQGGVTARATGQQMAAARQRRMALTSAQTQQMRTARADPNQRASVNHGRPAVAATRRPGAFNGAGVVRATRAGAPYRPPTAAERRAARLPAANGARPAARGRANPAGARRRPLVTAPGRAAPRTPEERRAAPRSRPAQPSYHPGEGRAMAPRPNTARPPAANRPAPERRATRPEPQQRREARPAQQRRQAQPQRGPEARPQERRAQPRPEQKRQNPRC